MKLNKNNKFWAEIEVLNNGNLKIKKAQKYSILNQHSRQWTPINAREFARAINTSKLVIK